MSRGIVDNVRLACRASFLICLHRRVGLLREMAHSIQSGGSVAVSILVLLISFFTLLYNSFRVSATFRKDSILRVISRLKDRGNLAITSFKEFDPNKLSIGIDSSVPGSLDSHGAVLILNGWCFHPQTAISSVKVIVDDRVYPVEDFGVPRADVYKYHFPTFDPNGHSFNSGFWAIVPIRQSFHETELRLRLRVTFENNVCLERSIASIAVEQKVGIPKNIKGKRIIQSEREPLVAICSVIHDIQPDVFREHVEAIRRQTHRRWMYIIVDDASSSANIELVVSILGNDERFRLEQNSEPLGTYRSYERCLSATPEEALFITLADPNDVWHPGELATLLSHCSYRTSLVYRETASLCDEDAGRRSHRTQAASIYPRSPSLSSLLISNPAAGSTLLFRRILLPVILPFPTQHGDLSCDLWIMCVSSALGRIRGVPRSLSRDGAVTSHANAQTSESTFPNDAATSWSIFREIMLFKRTKDSPSPGAKSLVSNWHDNYANRGFPIRFFASLLQVRCAHALSVFDKITLRLLSDVSRSPVSFVWFLPRCLKRPLSLESVEFITGVTWAKSGKAQERYEITFPSVKEKKANQYSESINYRLQTATDDEPLQSLISMQSNRQIFCGIESHVPDQLIVGKGRGIFVSGWCHCPTAEIVDLAIEVGDVAFPLDAFGIPHANVEKDYHHLGRVPDHRGDDGFYGCIYFPEVRSASVFPLAIRATFQDASVARRPIKSVLAMPNPSGHVVEGEDSASVPLVAICMTTFDPPLDLLERQIESIRVQDYPRWICIIQDDCSRPDLFLRLCDLTENDIRFAVQRNHEPLGYYSNFEKCLTRVPSEAMYVALADQDDYWYRDKVSSLVAEMDDEVALVYSDMRLMTPKGEVLANTFWDKRANNYRDYETLLLANTVTGAASLFRRKLLEHILPFPDQLSDLYHDGWIAAIVFALGEIRYIDRPLYVYTQHDSNVIGINSYKVRSTRHFFLKFLPELFRITLRSPDSGSLLKQWQDIYARDVMSLKLVANTVLLRCQGELTSKNRATLLHIANVDASYIGALVMLRRFLRGNNNNRVTLGREAVFLRGLLWRRFMARNMDNVMPHLAERRVAVIPEKNDVMYLPLIAPLKLRIGPDAPTSINILIPTIDLKHFFGGYISVFNLARRLAERDKRHVRILTVDPQASLPFDWRSQVESFQGLQNIFTSIEVLDASDRSKDLQVSSRDVFVATSCWTAYIAHEASKALGKSNFVFMPQEYEPYFFPMGTYAAINIKAYSFPHHAIFSTELLREYFRQHEIGVFALGQDEGNARSLSFQNAVTDVGAITVDALSRRKSRRLLFYARPEAHAQRNLYELGMVALAKAIEADCFDDSWEFFGIGSVGKATTITLPKGRAIRLIPRQDQKTHRELLRAHDVGLGLMYTPHPSLVPIEMASAGMLVVTNTFENKTAQAFSEISTNIIAVEATTDDIARGLREAVNRVNDYQGRVDGSNVHWATNWEDALDDEVMTRIMTLIEEADDPTR